VRKIEYVLSQDWWVRKIEYVLSQDWKVRKIEICPEPGLVGEKH